MAYSANKKFTIIWLDSDANNSEDNLFTQQNLFQAFDNVEIYEAENECQEYIQSKPQISFLIIVSGRLSRQIIPNIHELSQLSGIYIFCMNKKSHEEWSKQYQKIRAIVVELDQLISKIRSDLRKLTKTSLPSLNPTPITNVHDNSNRTLEGAMAAVSINDLTCPFAGYDRVSIVSLEQAIAPLAKFIDKVDQMAWIVKQNCQNPPDGLTDDESAAIALYTMEWYSKEMTFNYIFNQTLRSENKEQLKSWFFYLKLILKALSKLPSITRVVYQGTNKDVSNEYPNGRIFSTWEFSNCTSCIKTLEDDESFGKTGQRTLFTIECHSGKLISGHAHDQSKDQVLLLPGRKFQVISCLNAGNELTIVQLQEMETSYNFN
ncbi:unnamed protein product [Rotaria sordida]|uniref:NAD(P)(+)--arginine ADP-ribosyltransferase n=1 Tax=Rotaria sordida TaxID=392033 RepID=A0A818J6I6_9BILA|nr:unnamed protein product [Rotaria sordida]CAF3534296.1 unnamed protein product [Rotaria sordida]